MPIHAVDDLEDALSATRSLLLPFDAGRWLRLAVLALFASAGTGSVPTAPFQVSGEFGPDLGPGAGSGAGVPPGLPATPAELEQVLRSNAALLIGAAALLVLGALLFALVASVCEFALYAALRDESVALRASLREHLGRGGRLFAFRVLLGLVALAPLALVVGGLLAAVALDVEPVPVVALGLALPLVALLALLGAVVHAFTTAFVVPTMLATDRGVLAGWRRFWSTLAAEPTEYLLFAVVGLALTVAAGTVAGAAVGIPVALLSLPLVAVGAVAVVALDGAALLVAIATLGVVWLAVVGALTALVQVPVQVYFRYYALLVLGDTDPELDLIPDRRAAIRGAD